MKNTANPVYAMRAGRGYCLGSLDFHGVNLGEAPKSFTELTALADKYKALGFTVAGIPSFDCAQSFVVLFTDALPPKVQQIA